MFTKVISKVEMFAVADVDGRTGPRNVENRLAKMAAKDKPLDSRQKKAVQLLCAGLSPKCVADSIGVGTDALTAWRKKPAFKVAVSEAMNLDVELHGVRLKALYGKALDRVSELLDDPSPHIRVQAARLAFEAEQNIARVIEEQKMLQGLEERMDAIAQMGIGGTYEPIQDAEIISEEPLNDDHS